MTMKRLAVLGGGGICLIDVEARNDVSLNALDSAEATFDRRSRLVLIRGVLLDLRLAGL
jgi:hypothetical protein